MPIIEIELKRILNHRIRIERHPHEEFIPYQRRQQPQQQLLPPQPLLCQQQRLRQRQEFHSTSQGKGNIDCKLQLFSDSLIK